MVEMSGRRRLARPAEDTAHGTGSALDAGVARLRAALPVLAALASIVVVWFVVGSVVARFPLPTDTVAAAARILTEPSSYVDVLVTMRRVAIGFVASTLLGLLLGMVMGRSRWWRGLLKPWVLAALSVPGPVAIIFATLLIGISETSVMVALVWIVTPYASNIVAGAVAGRDHALDEMAYVFRFDRVKRFRNVTLPQLSPALFAALRTAFALSWKLVVVIEAIGASRGIGTQISRSFRLLDVAEGIAWAGLFVIVMWLVDTVGFQQVERRVYRWKSTARIG